MALTDREEVGDGGAGRPLVSVIVLNYNGERWLRRCLESLKAQTVFDRLEILIADNDSPDKSDLLATDLMGGWPNGRVIQHGANLGFCEGNNRAAAQARGEWLFFLNNDTWLEPECMDRLVIGATTAGAVAATPLVLNYNDSNFQSLGASGYDLFGIATARKAHSDAREVFMPEGCSYLVRREAFEELGGFDPEFFMFADEADFSWRLWICGYRAVAVPSARLHHRGAANVNPEGGEEIAGFRTSDTKRFYANRNGLMLLLKNAQHVLLVMVPLQLMLLAAEALVSLGLVRRWSFIRRAYVDAVGSCWRLRTHIWRERARLRTLRKRSDWFMLRFFRLRLNRWDEIVKMWRMGVPPVTKD